MNEKLGQGCFDSSANTQYRENLLNTFKTTDDEKLIIISYNVFFHGDKVEHILDVWQDICMT